MLCVVHGAFFYQTNFDKSFLFFPVSTNDLILSSIRHKFMEFHNNGNGVVMLCEYVRASQIRVARGPCIHF